MSSVVPTSGPSPRLPPDSAVGGPVREVLSLDRPVTDAGTQVRSAIDDDIVDEYVQALADGAQFPPVVVFRADGAEMLADGFHRVFAYRKAGRSEVPADVYHGTREDALWFALGANRAHGQRLTGADKRHAIELAYRAWPDLSQRRIARSCRVHSPVRRLGSLSTGKYLPLASQGCRRRWPSPCSHSVGVCSTVRR